MKGERPITWEEDERFQNFAAKVMIAVLIAGALGLGVADAWWGGHPWSILWLPAVTIGTLILASAIWAAAMLALIHGGIAVGRLFHWLRSGRASATPSN